MLSSPPAALQDTANSSWHHRRPIHHRHPGAQRGRVRPPQEHQEEEGPAALLGDGGERVWGRGSDSLNNAEPTQHFFFLFFFFGFCESILAGNVC